MPVRDRRPEDDRPLFRAVNEQRLIGPVGGGQDSQEEPRGAGGSQTATRTAEPQQGEKGPIARAVDRAQENNWVYPSVADAARRSGLVEKLDKLVKGLSGR